MSEQNKCMSTLFLKVIMYVPFQSVTLGLEDNNNYTDSAKAKSEALKQDCALRKIEESPVL